MRQCSSLACLWAPSPVKCGGTGFTSACSALPGSAGRIWQRALPSSNSQAGACCRSPLLPVLCCKYSLRQHHVPRPEPQPSNTTKFRFVVQSEARSCHFLVKLGLTWERSFLAALSPRARVSCWYHPSQDPAPSPACPSHQHIPKLGKVHARCRMALGSHRHTDKQLISGKSTPK